MHMIRRYRVGLWVAAALGLWSTLSIADSERLPANATRYDLEYPVIDYSGPATHNRAWRLQQQLASGALQLEWEPQFGYLRALLEALQINIDSQILVYSKTSLQAGNISPATPRALYFNDDTYVGYIHGSSFLEFAVIDAQLGVVFFGLDNRQQVPPQLEREGGRCLTCHDTYSMMGGGVPRVLVMSSPVENPADTRTFASASDVDDRTPIAQRWGGWYVTGRHGRQTHFGNQPLREDRGGERLRRLLPSRANLQSLAAYFDTSTYLSDKSDIAALLVLEHQSFVQNFITRANYKIRTLMSRDDHAQSAKAHTWAELKPAEQSLVRGMIEPLVRALFFADAAAFNDRIQGSSGFAVRFSKSGPLDSKARSLRELDLHQRVFRYPLSYLVYSDHFDALPPYARDYIDGRIAAVLQGRDTSGLSARISAADRTTIMQILIDTSPRLGARLQGRPEAVPLAAAGKGR